MNPHQTCESNPTPRRSWPDEKRLLSAFLFVVLLCTADPAFSGPSPDADDFFILSNGVDLRTLADPPVAHLLTPVRGEGNTFGSREMRRYCELKRNPEEIQWTVNDLQTGEILSRSPNSGEAFFGASASKIFVAASLLHKQHGKLTKTRLELLVKMIVKSDNAAWKELQRQAGDDGTDDSGREYVNQFVEVIGCSNTRGFQGWLCLENGEKIHGNELNTMALSKFLYDTFHYNYRGAESLWKIMHATKTGRQKINKYTPKHLFIGGKTGTYDGPNQSPKTIHFKTIRARNHVAMLKIEGRYYGISILSNTGSNDDVAVLGGGLMREFLSVEKAPACGTIRRN